MLAAPVGVSDSHGYTSGAPGLSATWIQAEAADAAVSEAVSVAVSEALRARHTVASRGPFLELSVPPGSVVEGPLTLEARALAPSWIVVSELELWRDGELVEEVAGTVRTAANDIAESLDSLDAPGKLIIESDPRGAELLVDGVVVGKTPLTYELASGTHVITLRKLGYATREQRVNVTSGVQERLSLNLTETKNIQRGKRVRAVGWTLVGVGAAGVIAGTTLLALHHEPVPSRCDDEAAIDVNGLCRWRYNLLAPGIGTAAVGAAGLIGGISLLTVGGKAKSDERDTARAPRTQFSLTPWSASVQHRF